MSRNLVRNFLILANMEENKKTIEIERETLERMQREHQALLFRCTQLEQALTSERYKFMFQILENSIHFPQEYIDSVAKEIQTVFTPEVPTEAEATEPQEEATE